MLRRTYWFKKLSPVDDSNSSNFESPGERVPFEEAAGNANLVSSLLEDGRHMPVLDIDVPHKLVPSTTPGHSHLYINVSMDWGDYHHLLTVLQAKGIIEKGFVDSSLHKKMTQVRLPHIRKPSFLDSISHILSKYLFEYQTHSGTWTLKPEFTQVSLTCPWCAGSGKYQEIVYLNDKEQESVVKECPGCEGLGRYEDTVHVEIPTEYILQLTNLIIEYVNKKTAANLDKGKEGYNWL